jgi:23S rRNA-/tRNA-specific pseudouridylate synthase
MVRRVESRAGREAEGLALLPWLARRFSYFDEGAWDREIAAGRVSLNGRVAGPKTRLAEGDQVAYLPLQEEEPAVDSSYRIVHEDADFLVIDKPPLLPCHPGGRFFEHSLWFLLRERYEYLHIATRLDRETSGLVLICLNKGSARRVSLLQRERRLNKRYLALVHGRFPDRLEAEGFLTHDEGSAVRKKRGFVSAADKEGEGGTGLESCATSFACLLTAESLDFPAKGERQGPFSLVEALPSSGRTHQIRASLASLGFPLVGDKLYGLDEAFFLRFAQGVLSAEDGERLILPYQALHCEALEFEDDAGTLRSFRAPLPAAWPAALPQKA